MSFADSDPRYSVQDMIAQQIHTAATNAKTQAAHQQAAATNGFLSALSSTDSSLNDLAQNTGATAAGVATQAVNGNKAAKTADATATPYIQVPSVPATIVPPAPLANNALAAIDGNALPSNGLISAGATAADAAAALASAAATPANAAATATAGTSANGNTTDFGNQINARIVAGAPIYTAQPAANLATVPPHVIEQAGNALPQAAAPAPKSDSGAAAPKLAPTLASDSAHALNPTGTPSQADVAASAADSIAGKPSGAPAATPPAPDATATDGAPGIPTPTLTHAAPTAASGTFVGAASAAAAASQNGDSANDGDTSASAGAALVAQPSDPAGTPTQVDAATHTAAPYVPVGEQLALNVKQALATGNNEMRIQLKPESLGTIDVKLNLTHDGRLSAVISADRSDTLNMLKQDSGALQQSLRDAGINADSGSLSFNLRGDAQSFAQNSSQGGTGNGAGYAATASSALVSVDTPAPSQRVHSGSLDIEV